MPGMIVPDTVTKTDLPLGGQRVFGVAVQLTLGGVCGTPFMLVIVMPPVPLRGSTRKSLFMAGMPPVPLFPSQHTPLKVLSQFQR